MSIQSQEAGETSLSMQAIAATAGVQRQVPEGLSVLVDSRTEAILEDDSWQQELGTLIREDLKLSAEVGGNQCGRLSAELRVRKSPDDGLTVLNRYVYLGNVEVSREVRNRGVGSALLNEIERHAKRSGATRIEGIISAFDLAEIPILPGFYKHRGYQLTPEGAGFKMVKPL